jgi:hypothetical protein
MGKNSQQRRAVKQRRQDKQDRQKHHDRPGQHNAAGGTGPGAPSTDRERAEQLNSQQLQQTLLTVARLGDDAGTKTRFDNSVQALTAIEIGAATKGWVSEAIAGILHRLVGSLFEGGWQPADVAHLVKRERTMRAQRLAVALIAGQSREHDALTRAPEPWLSQLEDLGIHDPAKNILIGGHSEAFGRWSVVEKLHADERIAIALQVMTTLLRAPRLEFIVDPPSKWAASNRGSIPKPQSAAARADIDAKALKLIRALLAKAEATTFEAEAEAFTAKAQEMMTRYSIDAAVLASAAKGHGSAIGIESRRVHIDNPYADEKATFLSIISDVNGARCIWSPSAGFATIMGFPVDLHLTDLLFTSLLVQATKASAEATSLDRRQRTPSYRRAFLIAYAIRIGERLEAAKRHMSAEAEHDYGDSLLPILADRQSAVDAAYEDAFPNSTPMRSRSLDAGGYHAGRAAADRAQIGTGEAISRT